MQFFDRPSRSKIALRGSSSRPATSEELLAKAKKAREQRAHLREQHHSARTLQRLYRSRAAAESLTKSFLTSPSRGSEDVLINLVTFSGLINTHDVSVSHNVDRVRVAVGSRPFVHTIVRRVVGCIESSHSLAHSAFFNRYPGAFRSILVKASALLFASAAHSLGEDSDSFALSAVNTARVLIDSLPDSSWTEQAKWGLAVHVAHLLRLVLPNSELRTNLLPSLASIIMTMVSRIRNSYPTSSEVSRLVNTQLAISVLSIEGTVFHLNLDKHYDVFAAFINALARPFPGRNDWKSSDFTWNLVHSVTNQSLPNIATLLSNVLHLVDLAWSHQDHETRWPLISVISSLIHALPKDVWKLTMADEGDDMDVDRDLILDKVDSTNSATCSSRVDTATLRAVMNRVSTSLDRMVSEESVRKIFAAAVSEGHEAVLCVCSLFNFLTRRDRKLTVPLRDALALWRGPYAEKKPHILTSLWEECTKEKDIGGDGNVVEVVLRPDAGPILSVFSATYAYLLYFQDVDEMFDSEWPFSVDHVLQIADLLKQQLFCALFVRNSRLSVVSTGSSTNGQLDLRSEPGLLDDVTRLLSRLHAVDSQRRFTDSDSDTFWEAGHVVLSSESFVNDAIEAGPEVLMRAHEETSYGGVRQVKYRSGRQHAVSGAGELLRVAPYLVPFTTRSKIFQSWVAQERDRAMANQMAPLVMAERTVSVRRKNLYEDAFRELNDLGEGLRGTIRVKFIDEHGLEEAGIDGGGVFKEFMHEVLRVGFSPYSYGLFKATPDGHIYPNSDAHIAVEDFKTQFEFLGRLLGKAVFDGVLVDIPLAKFFRLKMLGEMNYPTDLMSMDPQMYKSIKILKSCPADTVEDLGLTFTVVNNAFGAADEVELKKNGRNIAVTASNRIEYIHRLAHYRMNLQIKQESEAFLRGFYEVVPSQFIRLFSHDELQLLISGKGGKIDLTDWRRNTRYSGGYNEETPVIEWFWTAVGELSAEDQSKMLQFVTSSPRAPLLGFAYLVPGFCIQRAEGNIRLPTASTCMNLLKLPEYPSLDVVREKLKYALQSNAGFDLS